MSVTQMHDTGATTQGDVSVLELHCLKQQVVQLYRNA